MSLGADILLKIKAVFDSKPVEEATKKTEELGQAGTNAGQVGINASKGFAAMGQAAAASSGSIGGLASALGNMAQQLPALAGAAGPIGLAIAAFMAWKKAIDSVIESRESLAKGLRDTDLGNSAARVNTLTESYDKLRESILKAAEEAQRFYDAENSKDDAQTGADLAALELEKAQRLGQISPEDQLGRRQAEAEFADRRAGIEDAAARRKAGRNIAAINAQASAAAQDKAAASEQMDALMQEFSDLGGQYARVNEHTTRRANQWWRTRMSSQRVMEGGAAELAGIQAAMSKVAEAIKQAAERIEGADKTSAILKDRAEEAAINKAALVTSQQAAAAARGNEASDIRFAIEDKASKEREKARVKAERERIESLIEEKNRQQEAAEEHFGGLKSSASRRAQDEQREAGEFASVAESYRKKGDRKGYAKAMQDWQREQAEADAASQELLNIGTEAVRVVKGIRQEIDTLKEQLKRVGQ